MRTSLCPCGLRHREHSVDEHNAAYAVRLMESRHVRLNEQDMEPPPSDWRSLCAKAVAAALQSGEHDAADALMKMLKKLNGNDDDGASEDDGSDTGAGLLGITAEEDEEFAQKQLDLESAGKLGRGIETEESRLVLPRSPFSAPMRLLTEQAGETRKPGTPQDFHREIQDQRRLDRVLRDWTGTRETGQRQGLLPISE